MKIHGIMMIKFAGMLALAISKGVSLSANCIFYDTGDDTLNQVLCTVRTNGWVDLVKVSYVIGDAAESSKDIAENRKKLDLFAEYLYNLNCDAFDLKARSKVVYRVYELILQTSRYYPKASDKERWEIRLKALEWKKKQLDRLMASQPEDNRPWPEKWRDPRAPIDSEKGQWDDAVFRMKSRFYRSDLRTCVQAAEDDRYSDEFRAWCFKEIEKIIGRPLTDDDIMFKDEVLRRRAKRLIDRISNAWNESVVSFTNIAYKASAAINRIAGQRNRLKCAEAYSDRIKECLNKLDNSDSKSSLMADSVKLSSEQKESLLKIVVEITGETPKWYQKELDEKLK